MRHTEVNRQANKILGKLYLELGITTCEIKGEHCTGRVACGWAHRHKRNWYWERGKDPLALLSSITQTILACTNCHNSIEFDKEKTELIFARLRPENSGPL